MRLKNIRLSGFKSFVEPTDISLPGTFSCIVGPNGCGKSNIVDAVRWVIGESSSRHLRSASMAEVIFNGSADHKPLSRAAVELLLDNSDGTYGGAYARYAEILVRREVHREGESQYSINGARCRRRDVVDIFLGTGLGPHSYAIIEQGMIARMVDARPEELRVLLEEAAGVSRYRERRREAERRIRGTRQNLERLEDLLEELASRLRRLKQQSGAAERYARYRERERRARADLAALQVRACLVRMEILQRELRERQNRVEEATAALRAHEKEIEGLRQRRDTGSDQLNRAQAALYEINADAVRAEEAIRSRKERDAQLLETFAATARSAEQLQEQISTDRLQLEDWGARIAELDAGRAAREREREAAGTALEAAQAAVKECGERRDAAREHDLQTAHRLEQCRSRSELLEAESGQLAAQIAQWETAPAKPQDPAPAREYTAARKRCEKLELALHTAVQALEKSRTESEAAAEHRRQARALFEQCRGRSQALELLLGQQQEGTGSEVLDAWLEKLSLADARPLSQVLQVDAGWEMAVELALGGDGAALCVDELSGLAARLSAPAPEAVEFVQCGAAGEPGPSRDWTPLVQYVRGPFPLSPLLDGVYAAADSAAALEIWPQLRVGEAVVCPEGLWLAPGRVRVAGEAAGGLQLRAVLEDAARAQDEAEKQLVAAEREFTRSEGARQTAQDKHEKQRQALDAALRRAEVLAERQQRWQQSHEQRAQMQEMIEGARKRREQLGEELVQLHEARKEADRALAESTVARNRVEAEQAELEQQRAAAQREFTACEEALQEARLEGEGLAARRQEVERRVAHFERQLEETRARHQEMQGGLEQSEEPLQEMREDLDRQLAQRAGAEEKLKKARAELAATEEKQRAAENARDEQAHTIEGLRDELEQARLQAAAVERERDTTVEKITELGLAAETVLEELPEDAQEEELEREVQRLQHRIERIGPVNLAAAEEYQAEAERREHLDKQYSELDQTLSLLEKSIRDIDRETRRLFQETFTRVNEGLEAVFPRLFGGGRAQLEMEDTDPLQSGIRMMARPPGKRNTGVQQLSGGEKTLAALALILAIFRLNPAPFCILDEVDAPLDDANILRFVQLVREICEQVQIICVTHNKITMEDAQHLIGVTMVERGVSRVVSVDIAEAQRLAEPALQQAAG